MTREDLEQLIYDTYGVCADYPFAEDLQTGAFRHENGRWFCLAMRIRARRLGHKEDGCIDVINLKCAPEITESLVGRETGIYPAYHMNKTHWLSVALGECDGETVRWLLGISYELTATKIRQSKKRSPKTPTKKESIR